MLTTSSPSPRPGSAPELRWYAPIACVLNLVLLMQVVHRFHHAATPINYGLARVLATALAVNVAAALAIVWLARARRWNAGLGAIVKLDVLLSLMPFALVALRDGDKARVFHLFASVYVFFLLCRAAELLFFAAQNAASTSVRIGSIVFAATFLVYGGVVPWMALASSPQGDEAHFMILTHSLVFDHDFDVGDNYAHGDYREEFPPPSPGAMRGYPYAFMERDNIDYLPKEPHVIRNFRGKLMLEHDMGFPLLLVPGYALDKREGALFTVSLIAAAGAAGLFELAMLMGATTLQALLMVFVFCFACPFWTYTQAVFLDAVGASGSVWIALQFFRYRKRAFNRYLLLSGTLISLLPWLNIRYWSLTGMAFLVVSALVIRQEWGKWSRLIGKLACLGVPCVVSILIYSSIDKVLFNEFLPNASMVILSRSVPQFQPQMLRGLLGIFFDQSYGLIPVAPIYLAAAAGMIVLFRRDRWGFAALLLPAVGYLPFVSSSQFWYGGWCAPGRFVLSVALPMAACSALLFQRAYRWLLGILAAWSLFIALLFTINPFLRMPSVWILYQISMLVEFFHDHIHTPLYSILSIFPNMMLARPQDWMRAWLWLIAFSAAAWLWASRTYGSIGPTSASGIVPAEGGRDASPTAGSYLAVSMVVQPLLLVFTLQTFQLATTPLQRGLARVLLAALAISVATVFAILWLGLRQRWLTWFDSLLKLDLAVSALPLFLPMLAQSTNVAGFRRFAVVYVFFLLAKMAELLVYAAKNAAAHPVPLAAVVFALSFLVYGGIVPWMALASSPQGDEAHFMVLTHSLAVDHDFDVGDNYARGDYREQFPPPSPGTIRGYPYAAIERDNLTTIPQDPHVVRNARGQLLLEHDIGFPILLVPGYALDRREGALLTISLIGAIGAAGVYELATLLGAGTTQSLLTVVLFCFACPFWTYTQAAFADIAGATGSLWIAVQFFRYRRREYNRYLLLSGTLIALLPWLNIRYWSLAGMAFLVVSAWVIRREWSNFRLRYRAKTGHAEGPGPPLIAKLACLGVPCLVSILLYSSIDKVLFDRFLPNAAMLLLNHTMPQFAAPHPILGLLGILFDQSYGLLPVAPIYLAAAAGMIVLYRRDRWGFAALLLPAVGYLPFISSSTYWSGGWCAPGRLILSAAFPMAPCAALVLTRKVRWVVAILAAWSVFIAVVFTVSPFLRTPSIWVFYQRSMLVEWFHDLIPTMWYSVLGIYPNMMLAQRQDWLRAWFWLIAFSVAAWAWARVADGQPAR